MKLFLGQIAGANVFAEIQVTDSKEDTAVAVLTVQSTWAAIIDGHPQEVPYPQK